MDPRHRALRSGPRRSGEAVKASPPRLLPLAEDADDSGLPPPLRRVSEDEDGFISATGFFYLPVDPLSALWITS